MYQVYQVELETKVCEVLTITEKKAPTMAFSWLKVPSAFTFNLRIY